MEDFDVIETPENVLLEQRLAGIGSRFAAGVYDSAIILLSVLLLVLAVEITAWALRWRFSHIMIMLELLVAAAIVFLFLLYWGYFAFFEWWMNGQTPGKRRVRIRVVREGGGPLRFSEIAVRNLLRPVDWLPFGYALAGLCMFLTQKMQRLGDLAAGTVVICEEVSDYSAKADKPVKTPWEAAPEPAALRESGLTSEEYAALTNYRLRRSQLTLEARQRLLPRLLDPVAGRLGRPLPPPSLELLEAYLDELLDGPSAAGPTDAAPPPEKSA